MGERGAPALYTIPAHRAFADALATGVLARHGGDVLGLARGAILVPNNRAARAISEAFVRQADAGGRKGLLLPRLVALGDADIGLALGPAFDPLALGIALPPAVPAMERLMLLARLVQEVRRTDAGEAMRLAQALADTLDQLLIEGVDPRSVIDLGVAEALSAHWKRSLLMFALLAERWPQELAKRGLIDAADRRNRLLRAMAEHWESEPPAGFVIAAGLSDTAPAVAALLRVVATMKGGQVVLAGLDQYLPAEDWAALGPFDADEMGRRRPAAETHPQFALKILLDRMGFGREEVITWRWGSEHDARAQRSRNISNAMLPPTRTTRWRDLATSDRSLAGIRAVEAADAAEEAQAVALALREAVETPHRTAALVTPDRQFAARVSAHLQRWGIAADDSAGQPLSQLPPGTLLLALADAAAERFAPVPLLALLKHPLVRQGDERLAWLDQVRTLDLLLRGPRPPAGLAGIDLLLSHGDGRSAAARSTLRPWWQEVRDVLGPLEQAFAARTVAMPNLLAALRETASALSGDAVWTGPTGHIAASLFAEIEAHAGSGPRELEPRGLSAMLEHLLAACAVRPPQGGHPRVAIWGLIEARLQQRDLMILSGLNEGSWPPLPAPDPWLAPRIRRELGLPGLERRIGIAAHDLANGLGAPQVLITRARRDASAPTVASRFWLRMRAMSGRQWSEDRTYLSWTRAIDDGGQRRAARRPAPCPPAHERPRRISVTEVDRLKADPFAFYARRMLGLARLDPVDADPSAAWRGTAVHAVLEAWWLEDKGDPEALPARAKRMLEGFTAHPLMRALWQPRLMEGLRWVAEAIAEDAAAGRGILLTEAAGQAVVAGVTLSGKADRIDKLADGSIAIVDYKTGKPPSTAQVAAGFSMQLGLLGLIAEAGGFPGLGPVRRARTFEYWSMQKRTRGPAGFGYRQSPVDAEGKRGALRPDDFVATSQRHFSQAAQAWLTGDEPFTARLVPDLAVYDEYDQLMRLEEWYGRADGDGHG